MNRKALSRISAVLTVTALLSASAWAGEWARREPSPGLFATVWQLLSSLVVGTTETADSDGRAGMDPNGGPAPTQSGTDDDGRASMDPNG